MSSLHTERDAASPSAANLDIAIIGMSGRFPGAPDVEAFWRNLCAGVESIERLERGELLRAGVDAALLEAGHYVAARGLLSDIDRFDAELFGYAPSEAAALDPQHRLFLECAFEAFEHAGRDPERAGVVGVYAGSSANGYLAQALQNPGLVQSAAELSLLLGSDKDFLTTRVSYKLNLTGPSVAVQTACSTSLVAVHLACQALLNGECDLALAGGASISVPQHVGHVYQEGGIGSPDGHCRAFDANARGTVSGSGVGVVLLERLEDARRRGDAIIAVIKGSAINNDGHHKVGFTAPAVDGQARVIRAAHAAAGVDAASISYVEAHGTGTALGDPIEVSALTEAFGGGAPIAARCALGSVKTNVGHLDAAAGITGLIKVAQALRHKQLPPSLHFEAPNPAIDFERGPFRVVRELTPWSGEGPLRAGVSSFGLGGTNAHVVLEEAPTRGVQPSEPSDELLVLSARSARSLDALSAALAEQLERQPELDWAAVAHTLQTGRRAFEHRRSFVAQSGRDAARRLRQGSVKQHSRFTRRAVVFLFPGQGVLAPNQCRELYAQVSSFADDIDACAEQLRPALGVDVRELLFPSAEKLRLAERRVLETELSQPLLFVLEHALARLWMSLGVRPDACIGHSLGEWVAACLGGSCALEDALSLMVERGRAMQACPEGGMLAVAAEEAKIAAWLSPEVTLAASNAPRQCVLSGLVEPLERVARELSEAGIAARRLPGARAFHSALMEEAAQGFAREVAKVSLAAPRVRWVSNVTGQWITDAEARSAEYWARQLRQPVRFAEGVQTLLERFSERAPLLLEVGPGETLTQLCRQNLARSSRATSAAARETVAAATPAPLPLASLPGGASDHAALLGCLGSAWEAGVAIDFAPLWRDRNAARVHLPTTPFERQSHWLTPSSAAAARVTPGSEVSGDPRSNAVSALEDWFYVPSWKREPLLASASAAPSRWLLLSERGDAAFESFLARITRGLERAASVTRLHTDAALGEALRSSNGATLGVLHASALLPRGTSGLGASAFFASQERGALSLIRTLQALGSSARERRLVVLGTGLADVTGEEPLRPEHAPLLGVCRSAVKEYPLLALRVIDLPVRSALDVEGERSAWQVLAEACSSLGGSDPLVVYRGQHRWAASVTPVRLGAAEPPLRKRGVYLLLGGLGGVGSHLAQSLATRGQARLALVGRSAKPTPEVTQAIERAGGEVACFAADITDGRQLRAAIEAAERRFGALNGVIHAAGLEGGRLIARLTPEGFMDELGPKVIGALLLDEVLGARALDFVLYCSSLTALSGGVGQAGYAAANACLDALAQSATRGGGRRTLSINFDRWQGVGMAARSEARLHGAGLGETAWQGMAASEGVEVFERLLSHALEVPQVLVSRRVLDGLPRDEVFPEPFGSGIATPSGVPTSEGQRRSSERPSPAHVVERVGEIWAAVLGVGSVDPEQSFFEQGGESLLALSILNRVRDAFGTELSLREFFACPTVHGVAEQVARAWPEQNAAAEPTLEALPRSARRLVQSPAGARRSGEGEDK